MVSGRKQKTIYWRKSALVVIVVVLNEDHWTRRVLKAWAIRCATTLPRTCCSRLVITFTACCRIVNLVCSFSLPRCIEHMRPSSWNASLISRTLTLRTSRSTHRDKIAWSDLADCKKKQRLPPTTLPSRRTDIGLPASMWCPYLALAAQEW